MTSSDQTQRSRQLRNVIVPDRDHNRRSSRIGRIDGYAIRINAAYLNNPALQVRGIRTCMFYLLEVPLRSLLALPKALWAPPRIESTDQAAGMMPVSKRVRPTPRWPGIHQRSLKSPNPRRQCAARPGIALRSARACPPAGYRSWTVGRPSPSLPPPLGAATMVM